MFHMPIDPKPTQAYRRFMPVQITPALERELQHLAEESDIPVGDLVQQAIEEFVAYRRDLIQAIRVGEESAERDGWVPHDEVVKIITDRFKTP